MKKAAFIFVTLSLAFSLCSGAFAQDREGRFETGMGLGLSGGQSDVAFVWASGVGYHFTDLMSADFRFYLSVDGTTIFGLVPRFKLTFDLPIEYLEAFADIGAGILIPDANVDPTWVAGFGGGMYYWLLDGHLGIGTDLDFTVAGGALWDIDEAFNVVWLLANTYYRF